MPPEIDIQKLEEELERLRKLVYYDELTGRLNRRGFLEEAGKFFAALPMKRGAKNKRHSSPLPLSIIFIDIDNFKKVNDTHGHDGGDRILRAVAEELPKHFRTYDLVCRWGGEEFVAALIGADVDVASKIAERAREAVEKMAIDTKGEALSVTLSLGVAKHSDEPTLLALVDKADGAMYQAKQSGKNRVVVHGDHTQARLLGSQ